MCGNQFINCIVKKSHPSCALFSGWKTPEITFPTEAFHAQLFQSGLTERLNEDPPASRRPARDTRRILIRAANVDTAA